MDIDRDNGEDDADDDADDNEDDDEDDDRNEVDAIIRDDWGQEDSKPEGDETLFQSKDKLMRLSKTNKP